MILSTSEYGSIRENTIAGRYITHQKIVDYLKKNIPEHMVKDLGRSVQNRMIPAISLGSGEHKILMWSQMHGNESTTTKSVIDLINYLQSKNLFAQTILEACTIMIVPMLNPDGAEAYTRVNANHVDLNRDAQDRTQPESRLLRILYDDFKPHFCLNLHDQRTIYNVGCTNKPATISFLAPAFNQNRDVSETRLKSMALICEMNHELQKVIPGHIGRYDDAFNPNCVGDAFQMLKTPTILFEAGHFFKDYEREETRKYIVIALLTAIEHITLDQYPKAPDDLYYDIPENSKQFYDVLVRNAQVFEPEHGTTVDLGILYREVLQHADIVFEPEIEDKGNLKNAYGHQEYDCFDIQQLELLKKQPFWPLLSS